jgi:hypothetical protein
MPPSSPKLLLMEVAAPTHHYRNSFLHVQNRLMLCGIT